MRFSQIKELKKRPGKVVMVKRVIPQGTHEVIVFRCDHLACGKTFDTKIALKKHYGTSHTVTNTLTIGGFKLFRFESEDMFRLFISSYRTYYYKTSSPWKGPNYYYCNRVSLHINFIPADALLKKLGKSISRIEARLVAAKAQAATLRLAIEGQENPRIEINRRT